MKILALFAILMLLAGPGCAISGPLDETRYCTTTPKRDANGTISRRADVMRAFKQVHPCPVTGQPTGPCAGHSVDHVIPLAVGGCDSVHNLQWLPNAIKSCANPICKDRWERTVYRRVL